MKNRTYKFVVSGLMQFPLDMLRYDCCFPGDSDSVNQIDYSFDVELRREARTKKEPFRVTLYSHREPTKERWGSFAWRVEDCTKI